MRYSEGSIKSGSPGSPTPANVAKAAVESSAGPHQTRYQITNPVEFDMLRRGQRGGGGGLNVLLWHNKQLFVYSQCTAFLFAYSLYIHKIKNKY